jgi:hypothetical protein
MNERTAFFLKEWLVEPHHIAVLVDIDLFGGRV